MDRQLRKELKECLRELEASGDIEACLRRHPERAEELRPYLETAASLDAQAPAQPLQADRLVGRQRLLSQLAELDQGKRGATQMTIFGRRLVPVAAAVLAAVFLLGGLQAASAVPGSPVPGPGDALPFLEGDDGDPALEALEDEHEAEMDALEAECEAREEALDAEHEAAEEALDAEHDAAEGALEAEHEAAEEALDAEHDAAAEALEAECEAAEEALEAEHEEEEEDLEAALEAAEEAAEAEEEAAEEAAEAEEEAADADEDDEENDQEDDEDGDEAGS